MHLSLGPQNSSILCARLIVLGLEFHSLRALLFHLRINISREPLIRALFTNYSLGVAPTKFDDLGPIALHLSKCLQSLLWFCVPGTLFLLVTYLSAFIICTRCEGHAWFPLIYLIAVHIFFRFAINHISPQFIKLCANFMKIVIKSESCALLSWRIDDRKLGIVEKLL